MVQEDRYVYAGDKPGKGMFRCLMCGFILTLDDEAEVLPPCPVCGAMEWCRID